MQFTMHMQGLHQQRKERLNLCHSVALLSLDHQTAAKSKACLCVLLVACFLEDAFVGDMLFYTT